MSRYALLVLPAANRVYGRAAVGLVQAELAVLSGGRATELEAVEIGGVPYVVFSCTDGDVGFVADASAAYALFSVEDESEAGGLLRPVSLERLDRFDDDLVTIPRYVGKTNEQFTKLLLNVALAAWGGSPWSAARVLDPVAGRGTTLNQALLYGCPVAGVEVDGRAVDAYETFLTHWLRDKRVKHRVTRARVRRDGKVVGRRFDVDGGVSVAMVHDDTRFVRSHFKRGAFDVVVGDLPYGVQHDRRGVESLLADALPGWVEVLAGGGAVALACNVRTLPRPRLVGLLHDAGLDVLDREPYDRFEHRVDQSIQRDVVVARKPRRG